MRDSLVIRLTSLESAVDFLRRQTGPHIRLGTALGIGKPLDLLNAIYREAERSPELRLEIYTALCLEPPSPQSGSLEERFLTPFVERQFGVDYPRLFFDQAQKKSRLPDNIKVHEFYLQPGRYKNSLSAQRHYISLNYTHVANALVQRGLNAVVQFVSKRVENGSARYSLGSNPDLTLDLLDLSQAQGRKITFVGVVHPEMPFMGGDAELPEETFDAVLEAPIPSHPLFALPKPEIDAVDHLIGFHASSLIRDGGTLQIGIGSLSDAVVASAIHRQKNNSHYRNLHQEWLEESGQTPFGQRHLDVFTEGLYGTSELVMDGFMHLRKAGILKREILDLDEQKRRYLHGAFFLGSRDFYQWLRELSPSDAAGICMTRVSKVNDLYDPHEMALRRQRVHARFLNTALKVNLLGGVASDTLETGEVISGVGGQYNFVAMAHELLDARSILMIRSTREESGRRVSNVVPSYSFETIPRHLRDIVITEYGIADLRGKTDEEVVQALIAVSDAEFHEDLIAIGQKMKKLSRSFRPAPHLQNNRPEKIQAFAQSHSNVFSRYPFGSDFNETELRLMTALKHLKRQDRLSLLLTLIRGAWIQGLVPQGSFASELKRMRLDQPRGLKEKVYAALLSAALTSTQT